MSPPHIYISSSSDLLNINLFVHHNIKGERDEYNLRQGVHERHDQKNCHPRLILSYQSKGPYEMQTWLCVGDNLRLSGRCKRHDFYRSLFREARTSQSANQVDKHQWECKVMIGRHMLLRVLFRNYESKYNLLTDPHSGNRVSLHRCIVNLFVFRII